MKEEKSSTKGIADLCVAHIRANKTKILWMMGLFLMVMPIHLFNFIFSWILISLMMKTEDECRSDSLYCSLPIRRWNIVISRFIVSLGIILAAILIGLFVLRISSIFSVAGFYPEKLRITQNIFFLLFPIVLMISIFFPLYFRYGHQPGMHFSCYIVFFVVLAFWVGLLYIVVSIASGSWQIDISMGSSYLLIYGTLAIMKKSVDIFGLQGFYMYVLVTMVLFMVISFILSIKFYTRREF